MKKLLLALLMTVGFASFGATQYEYGKISGSKNDHNNPNFAVFVDRGSSFGLQNTMYFNQSSYLYASFSKGEGTTWGAFYLDGSTKGAALDMVSTGDGKYTAVDANGVPVKFEPGDAIGFWVTDAKGNTVYNIPGLDGQKTYNGTQISNGNEYNIGFGQYGDYIGSSSYDQMVNDSSYVLDVKVGSTVPNIAGQPLPSFLAAVLLGGATLAALRRKKSNAQFAA